MSIKYTPYDYQKLITNHQLENERAIDLVDMGLGKTVSTLDTIVELLISGEIRGALIVAPVRVCNLTWFMEKDKWSFSKNLEMFNLRRILIKPKNSKKDQQRYNDDLYLFKNHKYDVYAVNYELLPRLADLILQYRKDTEIPFDLVVFDELSLAKNHASKRINAFRRVINKFNRRIGLTGTFMTNTYMDVFAQVRLIDGGKALGTTITPFRRQYFYQPNPNCFHVWEIRNKQAMREIDDKIAHLTLVLRNDQYGNCPTPEHEENTVILPPIARKMYNEMENDLLVYLERYKNEIKLVTTEEELEASNAAVLVNKLLQISSGSIYDVNRTVQHIHDAKLTELKKLLAKYKKEKRNVLIATTFIHSMDAIVKLGNVTKWDEKLLVKWNKGEIPVMVADYRSISHGLNLQDGGDVLIWYSTPYSYEGVLQMEARLARTGQKNVVKIHKIVCADTIDEAVIESLRHKGGSMNTMLETLKVLAYTT